MLNFIREELRKKILFPLKIKRWTGDVVEQFKKTPEKRIIVFQTPTHSNIGDHAIAEAQYLFISDNFPDYCYIEINQTLMPEFIKKYKQFIRASDILVLHGGGNFGNEYMREENLRRMVVSEFPENKIVIFPQTIYYSEDELGKSELKKTKELFINHKKLILTAREQVSYDLMKTYFPTNKVILTPDIVLYLSKNYLFERQYGLEVIRADQESILSNRAKDEIHTLLEDNFEEVIVSDMHIENYGKAYTSKQRAPIVENKFRQFARAKLAITDRLHGMVFATVTGTPCIVFSNYNQKVSGTHRWIKDLPYIKFVDTFEQAKSAFEELKELPSYESYSSDTLKFKYQPLIDVIRAS
ncbi:polysaccharide pyruvyl transferase family protein [Parapedobacter indicus]|uniref:Exopolysaccharide biosynthesis protein EpsI, predicted pyruvyl transferase n=1 Tax=Parapedobacter indicus TaxID=1477437 RepID=A0A1I3QXE5_9SPHI|nr:polysaccharide pyruvyl transferase family protein [Parapedobacter indicus]PPL00252.1 exopolysaccharide biosynthesis predicted pyruvyl transferase EpsI [Parapedobacter indicus]SFJ37817.1 Exopolysaccharide biosynthesis protein EpsI, predicted pyruvyl transferase [Parapedobacter indicus]